MPRSFIAHLKVIVLYRVAGMNARIGIFMYPTPGASPWVTLKVTHISSSELRCSGWSNSCAHEPPTLGEYFRIVHRQPVQSKFLDVKIQLRPQSSLVRSTKAVVAVNDPRVPQLFSTYIILALWSWKSGCIALSGNPRQSFHVDITPHHAGFFTSRIFRHLSG